MLKIEKKDAGKFLVVIDEKSSRTEHTVELDSEYYQKLTGGQITEDELIKKSFQFLLKREPKESILSKFNLKIIERYFPGYEQEVKKAIKSDA